ncbi:MAG: hypothetical protein KatS3mg076_2103 [Candidatus Binatia bacterium]|nr:MAG: hypothetical protein KatS3mg076_2103 [Candidatus Binatia bacterium]
MKRAPERRSRPAELGALLREAAAGKVRPAYLFFGEPLLVREAADALVDVLVPQDRRSMQLEVYDGRTTSLEPVLESARTPGFFGGAKVLWIREAPFFASSEKRADAVEKLLAAASERKWETAASRLVGLLSAAGWAREDFEGRRLGELPARELRDLFGRELESDELRLLEDVQAWALERGFRTGHKATIEEEILSIVEGGLPPGTVLLFTATEVDARKRVVKRLRETGAVLEFRMEREKSGALTQDSAGSIVSEVLDRFGKRIGPSARARLLARAGHDAQEFRSEVEKLCLYVGERGEITEEDVRESVRDLSDAWIFDLTDALSEGDARRALSVLRGLLRGGEHPLRLLALLHGQVRLLLCLRDCLDGPWRSIWNPGLRPAAYAGLLESLSPEEREELGRVHPYRLMLQTRHAARFEASRLREAICELAELDARFKSSGGDPAFLLERFVLRLCGA